MAEKKKNLYTPNLCFWIWTHGKNTRPGNIVYGLTSTVSGTLGLNSIIAKRKLPLKIVQIIRRLFKCAAITMSWMMVFFYTGFKIHFVSVFF